VIEIPVEVGDGATLIRTAVRAESLLRAGLLRAVEAVRAYYHGASIQVVYPIGPEGLFVRDSIDPAEGLFGLEMLEKVTG
jgi:hypothetical protein